MTSLDDQLQRLLHAAGRSHPAAAMPTPAFGVETRALAVWRSSRLGSAGLWDVPLLVRGLVVATCITAASFVPAFTSAQNPFAEFLQLTDSTVSSDDGP